MVSKIKQVKMTEYGSPDVLKLVDAEMPQPKAGEVVIRVNAIGVNYSDILRRQNKYFMPTPLPFVLGTEAVGIVETELAKMNGAKVIGAASSDEKLKIIKASAGPTAAWEYPCYNLANR